MATNEMIYNDERVGGNFVTFPNQGIITSLHSDTPDTVRRTGSICEINVCLGSPESRGSRGGSARRLESRRNSCTARICHATSNISTDVSGGSDSIPDATTTAAAKRNRRPYRSKLQLGPDSSN